MLGVRMRALLLVLHLVHPSLYYHSTWRQLGCSVPGHWVAVSWVELHSLRSGPKMATFSGVEGDPQHDHHVKHSTAVLPPRLVPARAEISWAQWHTSNRANTTIVLDSSLGQFESLVDSVVEDNEVGARHTCDPSCVFCTAHVLTYGSAGDAEPRVAPKWARAPRSARPLARAKRPPSSISPTPCCSPGLASPKHDAISVQLCIVYSPVTMSTL